jgi:hypothetical protein
MAYGTLPLAVTGAIVPAAWGNQARDNDEYLKGRSGVPVVLENSASGPGFVATGATAAVSWNDRTTSQGWTWYASGGSMRLYNNTAGDIFALDYTLLNGAGAAHLGLMPNVHSQSVLTGFLRAGTWTYNYNGDSTIASQVMSAAGPLNGWAITYEYSSARVSAMRLRIGGAGGTIVQSIVFAYDGSSRISTEAHS